MTIDPHLSVWTVPALLFAAVTLFAFFVVTSLLERRKVRERYAGANPARSVSANTSSQASPGTRLNVDAKTLGLDDAAQKHLRSALLRAGYFGANAVVIYVIIRTILVIVTPLAIYFLVQNRFGHWSEINKFAAIGGSFLFSYYLGQGYLDRRQRHLEEQHRLYFPDFLDMLVVCVDAGLSLEAALERVVLEIDASQWAFRTNLQLMLAETRAGKTTMDAMKAFSERLGLAEAKSLTTLLQQSVELGTDISGALSTYSEEMREKRMARAEEKAYSLPVKITIPLAFFILPTIFIAIMTPAAIKISTHLLK